ncbi:hypothetical protein F0562_034885 [Nyssa sinensis]|uniref:DUF4378 domain-containing protein n=1 Tax=Nyssa sinensis TaxID=561372 RepID=A0A5J5AA45_9ASTE|nr:hypothetical protein F0562_034885 [Nyssa sinensis]
MGVEKQGSKGGGGYVGGFFQIFDWNAKSRKKLFSSKSDFPDQLKHKKRSDGNLPMTRLHLMDEEEILAASSIRGSSDYSCTSSVTDEEGCASRPPGVVARLMGLDSLPTSNFVDSTPFFDSESLQDAHFQRKNLEFCHDHQIVHSGNLHHKVEAPVRNAMEPKPQKMINRPIEKFQTEILPPKSAKSIPATHHKLLSPIKSAGFIPSKNAAHIMEAAAKIIEPGPQAITKGKMPPVGSSSVPLKVRDLKEKVGAAQKPSRLADTSRRPLESNAAKYLKGQSMNKSWNGSVDTTSFRAYSDSEECSSGLKNRGKSISLALQAKVNVQKREGLNPNGSRSLFGQKEQREVMSRQPFKSQPNVQKSIHKKPSTDSASSVLKQNNQKQNCPMEREKLPSKPLVSNSQCRKPLSGDSSSGRYKSSSKFAGNSKAGSRKLGLEVIDNKKQVSCSGTNNVSRKKRSIAGNFHFEKNQRVDKMLIDKNGKPIQSNLVVDRHFSWPEDSKRKGMDVVSFTFTAPMIRSMPGLENSRQVEEKNNYFSADCRGKKVLLNSDSTNSTRLSSLGYNVIGCDALSVLLEQKIREFTHGVESACYKAGTAGSSASILPPSFKGITTTLMSYDKRSIDGMHADKSPDFSTTDPQGLVTKYKLQGVEGMDEHSSNDAEAKKLLDCRHPSPISVLDPSFLSESCNSSDSADTNSTEGSKQQCSSVQAQEVIGTSTSKKFHFVEADGELSDSASSTSTRTVARMHATTSSMKIFVGSTTWELEYVKEILCNLELMFKDFALGRAREIINPHLFVQLESRRRGVLDSHGDDPKLKRKVLFDCVSECMDLRCRRYVGGGSRRWAKGLSVVRRKEQLAEEVYKEISGWRGMGDCMVDELVDKDMSSQYGKWLDFEVEAFELGVEIESRILNSLVDEVVADVLQL